MLSVKNLVKKYKPKKGVPVTAINDVTLDFPDKGMVFLLGKSGSGKSTLLNLLGGLDKYDGGEIIIKGVSSKKFKQKHFDSYRNTYIGFIFQEYNILEEFSVGANIALAIELQGRKCSDDEINKILHEVDLDGYGNRKPNELSGGQKQRVAIARALVKNPEIIMADEPTGALDSNTGRQVFDTLKKLSSDKLVLVVSHDREFAEQYADRIIELADGKVINDVELDNEFDDSVASGIVFEENCITVPAEYHLTAEDTAAINAYIDSLNTGIKLKIINASKKFKETKTELINQNSNSSSFKLIKSKLPMRSAFKIGVSGLKHKKVRLVFTILLSVVAFTLFGIADTFGAYNHIDACTNSIIDSDVKFATVIKEKKFGEGINTYWINRGYKFSDDEIKSITAETGNKFKGVYAPEDINLNFDSNFDTTYQFSKGDYTIHSTRFTGFMDITEADLSGFNASLVAGKLPSAKNDEIAISTYVFDTFKKAGYIYRSDFSEDKESINSEITNGKKIEIKSYNDMVGKTLFIYDKLYTVTGIIDTGLDISRYEALTEENKGNTTDHLVDYLLYNELRYETDYGISQLAFVGEGKVKNLIENAPKTFIMNNYYGFLQNDDGYFEMFKIAKLSDFDKSKITWAGEAKNGLNNKEFIVTMDKIDIKYFHNEQINDENGEFVPIDPFVEEQLNKHATFVELAKKEFTLELNNHYEGERTTEDGWKIVGYINFDNMNASGYYNTMFVSDEFFDSCVGDMSGVYNYLTSPMPDNESEVKKLVKYAYTPVENVRLPLQSAVTYELDMVNSTLDMLSDIFLYIGIGFAVFASLMLSNFISTSISYKKRDIGVLRAIGSRSNDVFRIFFSESFVIAFINFVFSSIGTFVVATIVNNVLRQQVGVLITILSFSLRQLILIFAVSLFVAASASYLPVKKIASKRPVDAIKNK